MAEDGKHKQIGLKRLAENFASLSVLQAANYILPLITLPYLVRVLGADRFGVVAFAQATMQFFIIATDYGFNLSATRNISAARNDPDQVSRITSAVLAARLGLFVVGFGVLVALVMAVDRFRAETTLFLLSYGMVLGNVLFPVWLFQGLERMKYSTAMSILAKALFVVLIFAVVRRTEDYLWVPLLNSIGWIVAGLIGLVLARVQLGIGLRLPHWDDIILQLRQSSQFFLAKASVAFYSNINAVVLGLLTTNEAVAFYAAAEKLFIAMRAAFYPVSQALYPYMTFQKNVPLFRKSLGWTLLAAACLATAVYFLAEWITGLVFGAGFEASIDILRVFALVVPISVATIMLGYPFLAALGYERYANYSAVMGAVVHLAVIAVLIPVMSPYRVALAVMFTESIVLLYMLYGINKHRLWRAG